jgi:thiamine-phosphate pyrophosphorylase
MTQIYLISPEQIDEKTFYRNLRQALTTNLVAAFQLRLKNYNPQDFLRIAKEVKKICDEFNCPFIINDFLEVALELGSSGVHLGGEDGLISVARKKSPANFIIGSSCYDSKHLAMEAAEQGASYVSFGTFFTSQTKNSKGKPTLEILNWASEMLDVPIVVIGGINDQNCEILAKNGADFIAVISYVWQHPHGIEFALKSLSNTISKN